MPFCIRIHASGTPLTPPPESCFTVDIVRCQFGRHRPTLPYTATQTKNILICILIWQYFPALVFEVLVLFAERHESLKSKQHNIFFCMPFNFNPCCESIKSDSLHISVRGYMRGPALVVVRERPELMSVLAVRARISISNVSSCSVKSTKELEHVRLSYDFLNNSWAGLFAYSLSSALSQWLSLSLSLVKQYPLPKASCDCSRSSAPYQLSPPEHTRQAVYYSSGCTAHQQQLEPAADFKPMHTACVFLLSRFQVQAILNWLINITC